MHGWVYVLSPSEYNRWVQQGGAEGSLADTGEKLFHQFACANCHHYSGHGPAPNLAGLYHSAVQLQGGGLGMADDEYIRKSILQPNAQVTYGFHQSIMPTYQGQLTEDQVIALIAYIKALGARPIRTAGAASGQEGGAGPANSAAEPTSPSEPAPQPIETNKPGGR
jgi:cytochrome c oxidase subunit 2